MDCSEFLHRYSEYDDSLLTPGEEARFRAHLDACGSCARYDRVLRKGRMMARQVPPPEPSREFLPRLQRRLILNAAPRPLPPGPVAAGGFLTLVLATVLGLWLFDGARPPAARPMAAAPVHIHDEDPSDRPLTLPTLAYAGPSDWTGARVDRRVSSSYSPLVTGPPAYRAARSSTPSTSTATPYTLD